jgi:putative tryptophan/tyrosine transport system substrate-binding protein
MAIDIGRRQFISALGGATLAWPFVAQAQQPSMPLIGFLSGLSAAAVARPLAAFFQGLKETGYVEGQNVAIEYCWADGQYDRLPALAADLVHRTVAVIVSLGADPAALAAKGATTTIPIVFLVGGDPVKIGLVASLNRPRGNATGVNFLVSEMTAKRLALLHELVPTAAGLGVLINPKSAAAEAQMSDAQSAAPALGEQLVIINASNEGEIDIAFATFTQRKAGGLMIADDPFFNNRRDQIVSLAAHYALPTVYFFREFAASGGLISYGTSLTEAYHQVGAYAGKILGGANPADLPVIQPTKFELVINLKTANALGLTVPQSLLVAADEVIE